MANIPTKAKFPALRGIWRILRAIFSAKTVLYIFSPFILLVFVLRKTGGAYDDVDLQWGPGVDFPTRFMAGTDTEIVLPMAALISGIFWLIAIVVGLESLAVI